MTLPAGTKLGRYEIRSKIGEGGMGEVYLAQDTKLDRKAALKVLPPEVATHSDRMNRFVQEAKAASALNHPNILTIYEIDETDYGHFIATEFVDGETLRQHLSATPMKVVEALDTSVQIASALSAAHAAGIIHRDVKPENIMLRRDGIVKVLDFGLAKLTERLPPDSVDAEAATKALLQTAPGVVMGTPAYMSPEQARGLVVDARTDIFSLGVVIYEMVAGQAPFGGATRSDLIVALLERDPPPLARFTPEAPAELQRLVMKTLAKDRDERYQTAKDLLIDLRGLKQKLAIDAEIERSAPPEEFRVPPSGAQLIGAKSLPPEGSTPNARRTSRAGHILNQVKLHKGGAVVTLAALILIAAVTLFWYFKHTRAAPLTEKDTILLADFVNTTADPVFDLTLRQALAVQLGQTPFLNIYPDDRIQETLRLMNRKPDERITKDVAREICERNGINAMLLGSIASLGNNYVITLEALNPRTGEALAREQTEAAGKEQVLGKLGDAAKRLREKLGESLQTIEKFDASIEQATTSSLEALKAYSLGQQLRMAGKFNESIPFHKRAIELDPNFASAHKSLGEAHFFTEQRDRAAESFTKAFELRERVSEREKFEISANYYTHVVGDLDKSVETLELWKQTYPREWRPRDFLAHLYNSVGQHEKALAEAQEAIRLYPQAMAYLPLAIAFEKLNRFEEAKTTFEQMLARGAQDSIYVRIQLYRIAFIQGDGGRMQQQIDWARGKPPEERMHYEEGRMAMFNGQVSRAERSFRRRIELAEQRSAKDAMSLTNAEFAFWNSFFGDCKETKRSVADALATLRGEEALNLGGIALAVCGEIGQAQSLADEIAKLKYRDLSSISFLPEMRAAIEISRNNPAKAVEVLESTRILERGFGIPGRATYLRGIAFLRQNAGPEAMNEFQKILDRRGWFDTSPFFPLAHLGLARAAALAGDAAKSRRAYEDFFALWKDADPNIPILIEAKKEYEKIKY